MFIRVFLVVMLIVIWAGSAGSGMKMTTGTNDVSIETMGDMLDRKIVEYYVSHANVLPDADNGCVSERALKVMGMDNYSDYRDNTKFSYVPMSDGTFRLTIMFGNKTFLTKNSNKVLPMAAKEEF